MINAELVGGPNDGEFFVLDGETPPTMEMMVWIDGTKSTYGWDGSIWTDQLFYQGEREPMK